VLGDDEMNALDDALRLYHGLFKRGAGKADCEPVMVRLA